MPFYRRLLVAAIFHQNCFNSFWTVHFFAPCLVQQCLSWTLTLGNKVWHEGCVQCLFYNNEDSASFFFFGAVGVLFRTDIWQSKLDHNCTGCLRLFQEPNIILSGKLSNGLKKKYICWNRTGTGSIKIFGLPLLQCVSLSTSPSSSYRTGVRHQQFIHPCLY